MTSISRIFSVKLKVTLSVIAVLLVFTLLASACAPVPPASAPQSTESGPSSPAETATSGSGKTPTETPPERPTQPLPGGVELVPGGGQSQVPETPVIGEVPQDLLNSIYQDLETNYGVSQDQVVLLRAESIVWPDGSLGCPQPGVMYTQALVEGYWVQIMVGDQVYDYRATQSGSFRQCQQGLGAPPLRRSGTPTN